MRWKKVGRGDVVDRRGAGGGFPMPGGAKGGVGGLGLIGVLLVILLQSGVLGGGGNGTGIDVDPRFNPLPQTPGAQSGETLPGAPDPDARLRDFVAFVVDNVQRSWADSFAKAGQTYEPTKLVLFEGQTQSGCGSASSATGPFYCPRDRLVYLDLGFFRELRDRFGAPGDFAQAYVIAHEFGHHIQSITGISDDVRNAQQADPGEANDLSVRLELQADCLAGVWGHSAYEQNILENGDLEEGLQAAAAIGDDRIQKEATGRIDPETWTHGSSEQRVEWFKRGFEKGDAGACDSFSGDV
ncbi:MAG: neutral zinc metallopeptidase [Actinobacteria bacterium]|nr:neutral zinc metallopeptidase [Actinomycetota bacterium]